MNILGVLTIKSIKLLFILIILFLSCTKPNVNSICTLEQLSASGNPKQQIVTRNGLDRVILVETDPDGDGIINDYVWVNASSIQREKHLLLFNEIQTDKNIPIEQIWFGPKNYKLIGKIDLNKDGNLESTVYYNYKAAPKIISGIVARIEVDSNLDGKTDIWIYPNLRLEIDSKFLGVPNGYTENIEEINEIFKKIETNQKWKNTFNLLQNDKSFALHPELITREDNKSVIQFGY